MRRVDVAEQASERHLYVMAFVHSQSCECVKSELDLFSVPPTQTSIEHGQWVEHHPLATITDSGPIEFSISGSGEDYLDLANTYVYVRAQIVKDYGTNLAEDAEVGPTNLWLHSLFSQVDVSLNEKLISPSTNTYPYRAYPGDAVELWICCQRIADDSHHVVQRHCWSHGCKQNRR